MGEESTKAGDSSKKRSEWEVIAKKIIGGGRRSLAGTAKGIDEKKRGGERLHLKNLEGRRNGGPTGRWLFPRSLLKDGPRILIQKQCIREGEPKPTRSNAGKEDSSPPLCNQKSVSVGKKNAQPSLNETRKPIVHLTRGLFNTRYSPIRKGMSPSKHHPAEASQRKLVGRTDGLSVMAGERGESSSATNGRGERQEKKTTDGAPANARPRVRRIICWNAQATAHRLDLGQKKEGPKKKKNKQAPRNQCLTAEGRIEEKDVRTCGENRSKKSTLLKRKKKQRAVTV